VDSREHRLVDNETTFREINERIEQIAVSQKPGDEHEYEFLCECSNSDCTLRVVLTVDAYERVRAEPAQFVVALGHELPEIEEVVFRGPAYEVVRKFGEAAELAEEQDPRS
jgi:hypothetical protein